MDGLLQSQQSLSSKDLEQLLIDLKAHLEITNTSLVDHILEFEKRDAEWKEMDDAAEKILLNNSSQRITINVSGEIFQTTLDTLLRVKDTLFYRLITSNRLDITGGLFLDRSPKHFQALLGYLRYSKFHYEKYSEDELDEIYIEAFYYEMTEIVDYLGDRVNRICFVSYESSGTFTSNNILVGTNKLQDLYDENLFKGICVKAPGSINIKLNYNWTFSEIKIGPYMGESFLWNCFEGANSTISVSNDRSKWTDIGTIPSTFGKGGIINIRLNKPANARFLRFTSLGNIGIGHLELIKC